MALSAAANRIGCGCMREKAEETPSSRKDLEKRSEPLGDQKLSRVLESADPNLSKSLRRTLKINRETEGS